MQNIRYETVLVICGLSVLGNLYLACFAFINHDSLTRLEHFIFNPKQLRAPPQSYRLNNSLCFSNGVRVIHYHTGHAMKSCLADKTQTI